MQSNDATAGTDQDKTDAPAAESTEITPKDEQPQAKAMSVEDYEAALKAARQEAAKYRTQRNEVRTELENVSKANQSDADRISALERKAAESDLRAARATLAQSTGLPQEVIVGANPDEMETATEALKAHIDTIVEQRVAAALAERKTMPVVAGENAGGQPLEGGDWLSKALRLK